MCAISFRKPTVLTTLVFGWDHTKGYAHLIIRRLFTDLYARNEECLNISDWFRQVIFFGKLNYIGIFFYFWENLN